MLDAELQAAAAAWKRAGRVGWWVELVAVRGSVPRGVGAAMLVDAAEVLGSIGGGADEVMMEVIAKYEGLGPKGK